MAYVAEQLVGRAAELNAVDGLLADTAGGAGTALLLAGEPGIGKTRLLAELAARADARGWLVLSGSASELESDLPFCLFVDALDEYVAGLDPRRIAALGDGVAADLAQVLPALGDQAADGRGRGADERYRAHGAVRALLERLASARPLALVLDDVHWADPASVELMAALLRRPPAASVLVALATRPRQIDDRLTRALDRAQRGEALTRLDLGGLARDEAAQLLGEGVDADRADALYAESGGNPFYLEQLARAPAAAGAGAEAVSLGGVEVPRAVLASLAEELALLPAATRRALEGAAVAGDPFEPDLAAAAAGVDEVTARAPLDDLLAAGLVHATDVPRRFRFRHPLVRRAVYESAPAAWRLGAHERCAAALAERGAPPAARAHHVEHAGRHGDTAAVAVLAEAAEAVFPRAPGTAAHWYAAALRLLPDGAPAAQRTHLLMTRALSLTSVAQFRDARVDLLAALALVPEDAVGMWVRLTAGCAQIEHLLGLHEQARARLADALHRLPDPTAPESVTLMIELAAGDLFRARYAAMPTWAVRAAEVARAHGDRTLMTAAVTMVALAKAFAGDVEGAEAARLEAGALIDTASDADLARRSSGVEFLSAADLFLDHYEDSVAASQRALRLQRTTGFEAPIALTTLGLALTMQGRLAEAVPLLDAGIEQLRTTRYAPQGLAFRLVHRALCALAAGDEDTALAKAQESFDLIASVETAFVTGWAALALGAALLATGDPRRAEQVLVEHAGGEEIAAIQAGWGAYGLELLTRCRLASGRLEDARRAAAGAADVAASTPVPMATSWAARAAAEIALADGENAGAAERARASIAGAERAGAPIEAAAARMVLARALTRAGDEDGAVAALEAAADAFTRCGAPRRREAAEQELRRLGRRVHRRARPGAADAGGLESLTGRELEVVDLVVDRRTNPEIAAELFLSLKTVETHLRNVFRKLGVSSRVELAREVERLRRS